MHFQFLKTLPRSLLFYGALHYRALQGVVAHVRYVRFNKCYLTSRSPDIARGILSRFAIPATDYSE